jgi:hypothetical protein
LAGRKIYTFTTMKTLRVFIVVILLCFAIESHAQILSTNPNHESGKYYVNGGRNYEVKLLQWTNNICIALEKTHGDFAARFYRIEQNSQYVKNVDIPNEYKVNDFTILGDSIYFCGYKEDNGRTQGYIAYVKITDLFNGGICKYTFVETTLNINKIKSYYNSSNERIIVGIGEQSYAMPAGYSLSLPIGDGLPTSVWIEPPVHNYDCLIIFKIVEHPIVLAALTPNNTITANTNIVNLYRHHNHSGLSNREEFQDIAITDHYICLASIFYFIDGYFTKIALQTLDKNTFNQVSSQIDVLPAEAGIIGMGFFVEALSNDNVAVAYGTFGDVLGSSTTPHVRNIVMKVNLSTNPFSLLSTSLIGPALPNNIKHEIIDIEYVKELEELLVARKHPQTYSSIPGQYDLISYLDISNNIPTPYYFARRFNPDDVPYSTIIVLLKLKQPSQHYVIIGCWSGLNLLDKNVNSNQTNSCGSMGDDAVTQVDLNDFVTYDMLNKCMRLYIPNCYSCLVGPPCNQCQETDIYYSIIHNDLLLPIANDINIIEECNN